MRDKDRKADMPENSNSASEQVQTNFNKFSFSLMIRKISYNTIIKHNLLLLKCESDCSINLTIH